MVAKIQQTTESGTAPVNQGVAFRIIDGKSGQAMNLMRSGMLSFLLRFFQFFHYIVLKQQKVSLFFTLLIQIYLGIIIGPGGINDRGVWGLKTCTIIKYLKSQNKITFIQLYGTRCNFFLRYYCFYSGTNLNFLILLFSFVLGEGLLKVTNILAYNYGVLHFSSYLENMTALVTLELQAVHSEITPLPGL